jgi:hypothetical protein
MTALLELFFLPPLAIARVGGSDTPLESFSWVTDPEPHAAHRTTLEPATSFEVLTDGSVRPYVPVTIRFKDGALIRPLAPFLELWASVQHADGTVEDVPLTLGLLRRLGCGLGHLSYSLTFANRKAERRTWDQACAFIAQLEVAGDDHRRHPLLAWSPHEPGARPLVVPERPIPIGWFQVIRPVDRQEGDVDLSVVRVRFTPPKGEVYGPPTAVQAMASTLPPGFPTMRFLGRFHEIVKPENRILGEHTAWSEYVWDAPGQSDPQPSDSYDGAHENARRSWGVVDDTSDGVITADLVVAGVRFQALARVLSTCQDYAPDRRHFYTLADDIADRDGPVPVVSEDDWGVAAEEVAQLFTRVFETVSQINLDFIRTFAILENESAGPFPDFADLPRTDRGTLTGEDVPYLDVLRGLAPEKATYYSSASVRNDRLPYSLDARAVHAELTDVETLLETLVEKAEHLRRLIRPPWGRFAQLADDPDPNGHPHAHFRDPRVVRDTVDDMRMPPYMRDSDENPLSLGWRQYELLMRVIAFLEARAAAGRPVVGPEAAEARQRTQEGASRG